MRRRLSKPAIFQFVLHVIAASFLASIIVVVFSQWWVFDLFSHFRIQYVLLGFLILPILLWLKRYWIALVVTVAIVFHSFSLWPYLQGSRVMASLEEPSHMTLLFANVYYEDADYDKVTSVVSTENPDVVVFAEVSHKTFDALQPLLEKSYPYSGFQEGEGAYDISYFSKEKPALDEFLYFSDDNPSIFLEYQWQGKKLSVLGTHPHSPMAAQSTKDRDEHLNAALDYAATIEGPMIVMGDFNISQFSPKFPKLLQRSGFIDTQLEFGLQPSWHASNPPILRIPIDQVVVNKDVKVYDRYVGASTGSDHLPVIVKVGVK